MASVGKHMLHVLVDSRVDVNMNTWHMQQMRTNCPIRFIQFL